MFRFKGIYFNKKSTTFWFQYILCFGSRFFHTLSVVGKFLVSIHPMFRFKCSINTVKKYRRLVSIHPMFRFKLQV